MRIKCCMLLTFTMSVLPILAAYHRAVFPCCGQAGYKRHCWPAQLCILAQEQTQAPTSMGAAYRAAPQAAPNQGHAVGLIDTPSLVHGQISVRQRRVFLHPLTLSCAACAQSRNVEQQAGYHALAPQPIHIPYPAHSRPHWGC